MGAGTISAIKFGQTGEFQGTHKFPNLDTRPVIEHRQFKELPMPKSVIQKVEWLAVKDEQKLQLEFINRNNNVYKWDNEEGDRPPLIKNNAPEAEVEMV